MKEKKVVYKLRGIFIVFVAISVVMAIVSQLMLFSVSRLYESSIQNRLEERASQYKKSFLFKMEADLQILQSMAGMLQANPHKTVEDLFISLKQANAASDFIRLSYFPDETQGYCIMSEHMSTHTVVFNETPQAFQDAVYQSWHKLSTCSEVYYEPALGYNVMAYTTPVYTDGEVTGVLTSLVSTEVYASILSSVSSGSSVGVSAVLDEDGDILMATIPYTTVGFFSAFDSDRLPQEAKEHLQEVLKTNTTEFFSFKGNKDTFYACILPIGVHNAKIAIVDTAYGINNNVIKMLNHVQVFSIAFFIASIIFVFIAFASVRQYNKHLLQIAYRDKLTNAYNKDKFILLLKQKTEKETPCSVVAIDIRKFKFINDLIGVEQSDFLLKEICTVLLKNIQPREFFCRDTADTFLLCLNNTDNECIRQRLTDIFCEIENLFDKIHPGYPIYFYCGVATTSDCTGEDIVTSFISCVMLALGNAKQQQRTHISFYDAEIHKKEKFRNYIENNMDRALKAGEFQMFLQPKVNLKTGKLSGAEALVRWIIDGKQTVFPDQFVPIFEQNGFCVQLDFYMVEQACKQIRAWQDEGITVVPISVNQTKLLFYEEDYVQRLCTITEKYRVSPRYITLEILEDLALSDVQKLNGSIAQLKEYGFSISMDDFGSGYSSLNTLGELRIDELKLDRAFVMQARTNKDSNQRKILEVIIEMAKKMNMTTVAKGIETADSEQMLKELSCDYGQGYYYSKPIPVAEFKEKFLSENQRCVTMGLHKEDTMIFDSLDRLSLYAKDFPALKTADAILKEDLLSKEPGSYTTDDPNCRYNIVHYETHVGDKDFEIHQREADLQIMLSGGEIMKAATRDLALQAQGYDADKDIAFVKGETMVSYTARPGFFALFLPGEPHAPGIALTDTAEKAKKVVFKIKV